MSQFPVHTAASAPEASKATLEATQKAYGFLPNLFGTMASSPALVEAYASLSKIFGSTSFSPTEQQIVLLATSELNGCTYCMAAHSVVAKMAKVSDGVIEALRANQPLADAKLEALRRLTVSVVESRGWPEEATLQAFYDAGYTPAQYLEVVLGVGLKTLSNYTNHIASTPLDPAFQPAAWTKAS
ncbi:MAG: carboxymuconolactone decarboxylase family protein [Acidobacteriota bacterium]